MLIQGSAISRKTELAAEKYISLIRKGIKPEQILVLVLNAYKKAEFIKHIKKTAPDIETAERIYTLFGLSYNAFLDNWGFISKINADKFVNKPNLCGLEVSQYIFKESIKTADFSDYISKVNLLHQLFRRYSLIVNNCLSNEEVIRRSKAAGESFAQDAQKAVEDYKLKTFKYNSFDYLRQLAVLPLIYSSTDYFKNIKYLIADDADEYSYAFWQFINKIMPDLKDYFICYDENGSSRRGYLCAYQPGILEFKKKYKPEIIRLESGSFYKQTAEDLFCAVKEGGGIKMEIGGFSGVKRLDMLSCAALKIKKLLQRGAEPSDIAVITPLHDEVLSEYFKSERIQFQILSGSRKLMEDAAVKQIITALKLINGIKITEYELKEVLLKLFKLPYQKCIPVINNFNSSCPVMLNLFQHLFCSRIYADFDAEKTLKQVQGDKNLNNYERIILNTAAENGAAAEIIIKYFSFIEAQKNAKSLVSEQIKNAGSNLLKEFDIEFSHKNYNFLLKEALSFETAFKNFIENPAEQFIIQIENSIISENPADAEEIHKDCIIVSSPQKIIDYSYKTKYQLWLDISSGGWRKNDTGTLYNAWVLSREREEKAFSIEENIENETDKTARVLRKLMLCAEEEIMLFSSLYDNTGNENAGGVLEFFDTEKKSGAEFKIIPRKDQLPVLKYKRGRLAVTAVPGAGKTTILLALVLKLMKEGAKPENIFVLTYMESAAKNFKERIKTAAAENSRLPNISTIHGLALRIIKENCAAAGLDENFEICDDSMKETIIRGLFSLLKIDEENYDNYTKCISEVKAAFSRKTLHSKFKEIQEFYDFYAAYNKYLRENNLIDYDDMLYTAVKLLEENSEIKQRYQNMCRYIIEDEAQDSTAVQQKLTEILSGKYNNLIRCGDINQSITSVFTSSSPEGFKNFIKNSPNLEMASSQRCAKPIYTLANRFIKSASEISENAFYPIEMQDAGSNPVSLKKPEFTLFETERKEKDFILNKVKEIKADNPKASCAVLLRLNAQAEEYAELFEAAGIKTVSRTDYPAGKSIYKIIYVLLKIIQNPVNNSLIAEFAAICRFKNIFNIKETEITFIKELKNPFIMLNSDEINSEGLLQLYFDISYFLDNSNLPPDIFAFQAGLYFSISEADKSNAYMISSLIKRLEKDCASLEELLVKLDYAAKKTSGIYKFFEDETAGKNEISIMTMHKSKGSEFDCVFIPELHEDNYAVSALTIKLKSGSHFVQAVKNQIFNTGIKTPIELKTEQADENLRLLYVGITRAKQELYLTCARSYKRRKNVKPLEIFKTLCT